MLVLSIHCDQVFFFLFIQIVDTFSWNHSTGYQFNACLSYLNSKPVPKILTMASSSSYETISNEFDANSDSSSLVIKTNNKSLLPDQERFSKSKLIDISWLEFNQNIAKKMSPEESLALAIHKTFAMVCQLSSINRIYRDSSTI